MSANTQPLDALDKLVPGGDPALIHLSDDELHAHTRRLVGSSNQLFAALLQHLAEVEARGIHRARACASMYTYCIYELRMSEDAAARRSSAARLVKAFPAALDAIAKGELHLTGLLMVGPHLTPENHATVLARAKFRTKKELAKLVRELHPLPQVPDRVEPLGPELPQALRAPTWEQFVASLSPPVRELPVGDRPADWANQFAIGAGAECADTEAEYGAALARCEERIEAKDAALARCEERVDSNTDPLARCEEGTEAKGAALARCELPPITSPQQYRMQFTTGEEHVELVERAKALLARSSPSVSLGELHQRAMQLLVEKLEKERFAVTERSRRAPARSEHVTENGSDRRTDNSEEGSVERRAEEPLERRADNSEKGSVERQAEESLEREGAKPRWRGRSIPAAVRREVFVRDNGRCSYVDELGQRCRETHWLELHHLRAFALGGKHVASNLALRCAAHNALAAEEDFGRKVIEDQRDSKRHESLAAIAPHRL